MSFGAQRLPHDDGTCSYSWGTVASSCTEPEHTSSACGSDCRIASGLRQGSAGYDALQFWQQLHEGEKVVQDRVGRLRLQVK